MNNAQYLPQLAALNVVEMSRDEWLEKRERVIGGTDIAKVVSGDPEGALNVYGRKLGLIKDDDPTEEQLMARELGLVMERPLAQYWADKNGYELVAANEGSSFFCRHPQFPFIAGSPDFLLARNGEIVSGLEMKTRNEFDRKQWDDPDTLPLAPLAQSHLYMMVLKLPWFLVPQVGVHDIRTFPLERDEAFEAQLVDIAEGLHKCIETQTPPPLLYGQVSLDYLKARYPTHTDELLTLNAEQDEMLEAYWKANQDEKDAAARKTGYQARMLELIKDDYAGVIGGSHTWTFKKTKDAPKVDDDRVKMELAMKVAAFTNEDPNNILKAVERNCTVIKPGFRRSHWKAHK